MQLCRAPYAQLLAWSADATPQYLGSCTIAWAKSWCRIVQTFLNARPSTPRTNQQAQRNERKSPVHLAEIRRDLRPDELRGLITTPLGTQLMPRIFLKVPHGTRFENVAVAFGSLNLFRYSTGWVLALSVHLQDETRQVMDVDCLLDPLAKHGTLQQPGITSQVEMVALADTASLPHIGAKLLTWPAQKRERTSTLLDCLNGMPGRRGPWKRACDTYLREHLQQDSFQALSPAARPRETLQASDQEHSVAAYKPGQHIAQAAQSAPRAPLVERCILLHRAGVAQEYSRRQILSRRMLLALEDTWRKFIWTPQASALVEQHRQQLTPGVTVPWLSAHEHLWIEFPVPLATPVCASAAALCVFSAADSWLLSRFASRRRP
ncbi:MAG TPA: hypothetical protein VGF67_11120 [Ktedonobacteraceae bacterium]|jgi:hypothetical protein